MVKSMGEYENVTLEMVYKKLQSIEMEIQEISEDLHEVKPEFIEKLKKIENSKSRTFKNVQEMEEYLDKG